MKFVKRLLLCLFSCIFVLGKNKKYELNFPFLIVITEKVINPNEVEKDGKCTRHDNGNLKLKTTIEELSIK